MAKPKRKAFTGAKIATLDEIQVSILARLTPAWAGIGLAPISQARGTPSFAAEVGRNGDDREIIQMATVVFLNRQQARRFGCTTASFCLEVGVFYTFAPNAALGALGWPDPAACHIRALLPRPYRQRPPNRDLPRVDRRRRDIWWVDESKGDLDRILRKATETIAKRAKPLLQRYSDPEFTYWYLKRWPGTALVVGAPFNVGTKDSPQRRVLIEALGRHINTIPAAEDADIAG